MLPLFLNLKYFTKVWIISLYKLHALKRGNLQVRNVMMLDSIMELMLFMQFPEHVNSLQQSNIISIQSPVYLILYIFSQA